MHSALVVLSGGQDSTTCLFHAIHSQQIGDFKFNRVEAISFNYGQRHERELDSAAFVYHLARQSRAAASRCVHMPRFRQVKTLGNLFEGDSPLTNPDTPLELYDSIEEMDAKLTDRVELTFVPGRNAVFLAAACGIAVARGCTHVITGVNGADNANYPDCTPAFVLAMEATMQLATRSEIQILTPLQGMSKKDIVELGMGLPGCALALAFTTTDYAGQYPPGNNHASVLRAHGFAEAEVEDPLIMRAREEGLL